jgi:hypothetical protein
MLTHVINLNINLVLKMIGNRESAIKRISLIQSHFNPSEDFNRELDGSTFNFDLASTVMRSLRPEKAHQVIKLVDSMVREGYRKEQPKEVSREKMNECCKHIILKIYEKGIFTPQEVIDDPDLFNR